MKDVEGVVETRSLGRMDGRWKDGRKDGQNNAHTVEGNFYNLPMPMLDDKNKYLLANALNPCEKK